MSVAALKRSDRELPLCWEARQSQILRSILVVVGRVVVVEQFRLTG